jgi:hypothetical protein
LRPRRPVEHVIAKLVARLVHNDRLAVAGLFLLALVLLNLVGVHHPLP